jgi:hypothetical protein
MSNSYSVNYSNPAKNLPSDITVNDGQLNQNSSSLTFIGRNYNGSYSSIISENLLHLLENFANYQPPSNPIQGQLWLDTSNPEKHVLRISEGGINWSPINGIWQQSDDPKGKASIGDIWVNTAGQQLNIWNGTNWTLVGPTLNAGTLTGSHAEEVVDTLNVSHRIIKNYVDGNVIEIIASENFRPNPAILGFHDIKAGINLYSENISQDPTTIVIPKINGVANSAANLDITIPYAQTISANSILRNDIAQNTNGALTIAVDGKEALLVGSTTPFTISKIQNGRVVRLNHEYAGQGQINFDFGNVDAPSTTLMTLVNRQGVGISLPNNTTPTSTLDVYGNLTVRNNSGTSLSTLNRVNVTSTLTNDTSVNNQALNIVGGVGVSKNIVVGGTSYFKDTITIGSADSLQYSSAILPFPGTLLDIGNSTNNQWNTVYARYFGSPSAPGVFTGNLIGTASSLTIVTKFNITGDIASDIINFNGSNDVTLTARLTTDAFTRYDTPPATTNAVLANDIVLSYRAGAVTPYKQTKAEFLAEVNYLPITSSNLKPGSLVPTGTIIPYAGQVTPTGWLDCDGASYSSAGEYIALANALASQFRYSVNNFAVPNISPLVSNSSTYVAATTVRYIIKT